jgi:hypothetical protein
MSNQGNLTHASCDGENDIGPTRGTPPMFRPSALDVHAAHEQHRLLVMDPEPVGSPAKRALTPLEAMQGLQAATARFNQKEAQTLLSVGLCIADDGSENEDLSAASERSIAHRLAFHLECWLAAFLAADQDKTVTDRLSVDCEYNRHGGGTKYHKINPNFVELVRAANRKPKRSLNDEELYTLCIAPDIIVHARGTDLFNSLVIEIKRSSNNEIADYDRLKLRQFTIPGAGYKYQLGAAVVAVDTGKPADRVLYVSDWFQCGALIREERVSNSPSPWLVAWSPQSWPEPPPGPSP